MDPFGLTSQCWSLMDADAPTTGAVVPVPGLRAQAGPGAAPLAAQAIPGSVSTETTHECRFIWRQLAPIAGPRAGADAGFVVSCRAFALATETPVKRTLGSREVGHSSSPPMSL